MNKNNTSSLPAPTPNPLLGSTLIAGCYLVLISVAAFLPAIVQGGFIWDDDLHVTANTLLHSAQGLYRIWFEIGAHQQYYPLALSGFWAGYQLWGNDPMGFHLLNVLGHSITVLLGWRLLRMLSIPGAWLIAAIWAIHPVQVETVAWVSEFKNISSGIFYMGAMICLVRHFQLDNPTPVPKGQLPTSSQWLYWLALLLFGLAMFGKTVACTLPAALLLLVWYRHGRLTSGTLFSMVPFLVLGLTLGLLTVWLEKNLGGGRVDWDLSLMDRFLIAGRAISFYAGKLVYPSPIIFNYPRWNIDAGVWWQYLYPTGVTCALAALYALRNRIGPGPLTGVLFFCGTLFPALGFFDVYPFRFSFVADHFQYLAGFGFIATVVGCITYLVERQSLAMRKFGMVAALAVLLLLGYSTWHEARNYESAQTLYQDVLQKNPQSLLAHNNLAVEYIAANRYHEALDHVLETVRLAPEDARMHSNLGVVYDHLGQLDKAAVHYRKALELAPEHIDTLNNLAFLLFRLGQIEEASALYKKLLSINPNHLDALSNYANVLSAGGKYGQAVGANNKVLSIDAEHVNALNNLAWLYATCPDSAFLDGAKAIEMAQRALSVLKKQDEQDPNLLDTLAAAYARHGDYTQANQTAAAALRLATALNKTHLASEIQGRLLLYSQSQPYTDG